MVNAALRNACREFTEEICVHTLIYSVGTFAAAWLIASVSLLPIGIGLFVAYDRHIGTILMSTGGVCLFITIVYALCVRFFEHYDREVAAEKARNRNTARPAETSSVQIAIAAPAAASTASVPATAPTAAA